MATQPQSLRIESDPWLAGILGYDVYRVTWAAPSGDQRAAPEALRDILGGTHGRSAFYYAKIPAQRVDQVRALCGEGFSVVDVNLTFERRPEASPETRTGPRMLVRDMRPADHAEILDIAGHCFTYTRFHLDSFFAREQANLIKREWLRNYTVGQRGERVLVAEWDGVPVGFLAVLAADIQGRSCRIIDLMGVSSARQGQGVGRGLVDHFIRAYAGECDLLRVGTQLANIPSARLYERCGFHMAESTYVLHAHVQDGKLLR